MDPRFDPSLLDQQDAEWEAQQVDGQLKIIREMIHDTGTPNWIRKDLWAPSDKNIILANIDEKDERIFLREMENLVDQFLNSKPENEISSDLMNNIENMKMTFRGKLTRAKGEKRERILDVMQIRQNIVTSEGGRMGSGQPGFLKRTLGRLFGRKQHSNPMEGIELPMA